MTFPSIEHHLEEQKAPFKEALKALVRIPSVLDESSADLPFGPGIDNALRTTLQIADGLGFRTRYGAGGYYGYAEVGEGEDLIGILGHLDVVPPGDLEAWHSDPFDPVEKEGKLYGRGVQDDKGPLLASLFAVKALLDAGVSFPKRVRIILGTDEENRWRGIRAYLAQEETPALGFSPDSDFPLIYAEKGVLQFTLTARNESGLHFQGGTAFNAVPDSILYDGPRRAELAAKLTELGFAHRVSAAGVRVLGRAAHAMSPEKGVNAIVRLCLGLHAIGLHSHVIDFVAQEIGEDPFAGRIVGDVRDEPTGRLKCNVGKIALGRDEVLSVDSRIPVTIPKERIVEKIRAAAERYGLAYKERGWLAPLYVPQDHPLIETLLQVYRDVTGDHKAVPLTSGGGTYARAVPNCVAFGPNRPQTPVTEHRPNEHMALADLHLAMEVYAHAIYALSR